MFAKVIKTNGELYTRKLVSTVRGQAPGNLPSKDEKTLGAEPTPWKDINGTKLVERLWLNTFTKGDVWKAFAGPRPITNYDLLTVKAYLRVRPMPKNTGKGIIPSRLECR